ncbi:magnesium chelatase domain-containing protein [Streptomyces sp. ME02-6987-2C]|uniref:magnesium chelatase domain-containing protein n=1 Tax=unclassified Streptomyces TaxID=2593676 RepID=UPI0029A969E8|nr:MULTISPECIES: magnesium chelatase domain-containing protein [unclassified Streptomyces]MDX3345915.1 magnesium chelatase domain-containing protein [Streptomyces sp. ME02-6979A]MDX3365109.1 magnesium chelatase domain-containing protein [Streptomyces sp. ME02-6987-2C]MDX3404835.1 magnesium chelatase domain-containing protein [Streptomyces sp. ME02-6977A]MDX3421681.1 magnesium chelatase domain-containing protein [Streptomyces sp. ME02-6985-2c]
MTTTTQAAEGNRTAFLRNTALYVGRIIREVLPAASAITVDTSAHTLHEVRDQAGNVLWYAPASTAHDLDDRMTEIESLLERAIPLGGLRAAGWERTADGCMYRAVQLPPPSQHARAHVRHEGAVIDVHADLVPADASSFTVGHADDATMRETSDRVRAAIINSGYDLPHGELTAVCHGVLSSPRRGCDGPGPSADLAIAAAVLATAGHVSPRALKRTVLVGELGLDGKVRDARVNIRYADLCGGYRRLIVAAPAYPAHTAHPVIPGGSVHAATDLRQALAFLAQPLDG